MVRILVITGMHRSGTSLTASLARKAGVDVGSSLLPAGPGNARGHFEDTDFLKFHQRLLSRRGAAPLTVPPGWSFTPSVAEESEARALVKRRSALPLWGFKDPRTSLFLDFWDRLLPDPLYLFLYRHPVEVTLSLLRRGLNENVLRDPAVAFRCWEEYNRRLLDFRRTNRERCLLWNATGMTRSLWAAFRLLAERLDRPLALEGLESLFHRGEFFDGLSVPEIDWSALIPDALVLYQQLEDAADLPSPSDSWHSAEGSDHLRPLLKVNERLLAAALCSGCPDGSLETPSRAPSVDSVPVTLERDEEHRRLSAELKKSRDATARLAGRLREQEEAWARLGTTKGLKLLRAWWTFVRAARSVPRLVGHWLSRLAPRHDLLSPEEVLVGCVAENDPKFLAQAYRLVQSIRWFGGSLASARVMVCAVEAIDPDRRSAFEALGAEVRIVPRFDARNPFANKLQFFPEAARSGASAYLMLDCDTLVVGDPLRLITPGVFQAKIADVPSVTEEVFERAFAYYGLRLPRRRHQTTFGGTPTIRYCNSGVVALPADLAREFVPVWREYNSWMLRYPALLSPCEKHVNQASLSLAFVARPVPFREAPLALNFPLHLTHLPPPPVLLATDPVILHYHHLVDASGYLLPSPYPLAQARIEAFNERLRLEREKSVERPASGPPDA